MSQPQKIRVAVLYGGRSGEHEVSLMSATNVIQYLDRSRFDVIPIGIDKQGVWFLGDESKKELSGATPLQLSQDVERMLFNPDQIGKNVQPVQTSQLLKGNDRIFDVIFPVIHGTLCEDGTVQGLLELADVPYVGCGVLSSSVCMDKDVSKRLVKAAGVPVADYVVFHRGEWDRHPARICERILDKLSLPLFVKPANTGSSVGVEKVKHAADLAEMIDKAFQYDTKVIVEQAIDAVELEVSVLESLEYGADPFVSVVGEVRPSHEFYSYEAKYLDANGAELLIPAQIPTEVQEQVRETAKQIFAALECEAMARVDLFLERGTNRIIFNEVNTIPGFTQISMYPKMMAASGVSYPELLTHLVHVAIARHGRKTKLSREYVAN